MYDQIQEMTDGAYMELKPNSLSYQMVNLLVSLTRVSKFTDKSSILRRMIEPKVWFTKSKDGFLWISDLTFSICK